MRDLRIIVIEAGSSAPGHPFNFGGENITAATRAEKALNKRAALLAGHLGQASNPLAVRLARAFIVASDAEVTA